MTRVLVTGGAGYVGSHAVLALLDAGIGVVVLDDLSTGMREAVPPGVPFVRGSTGDAALLREAFRRHRPSAVLHFAASLVVPESVARPLDYWRNNLSNTLVLAQSCLDAGIRRFVFSSTAAVYGAARRLAPGGRGHALRAHQPLRREQARRRARPGRRGRRARPVHRGAALLQRRRRRPRRPRRAAPPRRHPPGQGRLRSGAREAPGRGCVRHGLPDAGRHRRARLRPRHRPRPRPCGSACATSPWAAAPSP